MKLATVFPGQGSQAVGTVDPMFVLTWRSQL
jgi:hypothetical protein